MRETKLEKLARLSGRPRRRLSMSSGDTASTFAEKLSAPVSQAPAGFLHQTKIERVMADPETIYNWRRVDDPG